MDYNGFFLQNLSTLMNNLNKNIQFQCQSWSIRVDNHEIKLIVLTKKPIKMTINNKKCGTMIGI